MTALIALSCSMLLLAPSTPDECLPVDIILAEQTEPALLEAAGLLTDKRARRERVIALLKDTAARSQAPLLEFLESERAAGHVHGEVRSLWIHNVVSAEVDATLAQALAARSDVALVHHDPPRGREVLAQGGGGGSPTCGLVQIGAPQVWSQFGITGQGVVVGVIDTGLCPTHPDIAARIWTNPLEIPNNGLDDDQNGYVDDVCGWNFRDNDNDTSDDQYGHGSAISGAIAGDGTGGTRCGVAPGARIMVLKILSNSTGEQSVWNSIQYGLDNGADVLNGSLGWYHNLNPQRATWRAICRNAMNAGVVLTFVAGNEGCGTLYDNVRTPGDVPGVIAVGAVDCNEIPGGFSSCGPVTWQNVAPYNDYPYPPGLTKPDVCAPGVNTLAHSVCGGYHSSSGTSIATPHVAGLAALLLQADARLDVAGVRAIVAGTALDLGAAGPDNQFGAGRIDAFAAVQSALAQGNFCSAKPSTCGTLPLIFSIGLPSASASSGFSVLASGMRGLQLGMLVYTDAGGANLPFLGGHLCIQGVHRTPAQFDTSGTLGSCDGVLAIDMNRFRAGLLGGTPLPSLSIPGTTIHCQFLGRDPGNSFNVLLTGGLRYSVCP
jgi:subtilisin family serine protease